MMKFWVLFLVVSVESRGGRYFAEPYFVSSWGMVNPDISDYYFYLQQLNISTVHFMGELKLKEDVAKLMAITSNFYWTGKVFKIVAGSDGIQINACADPVVLQFFMKFEPKSGFDGKSCGFQKGNYTININFDQHLHETFEYLTYDPLKLEILVINENFSPIFGFKLQIRFHNLDFYKHVYWG